MKKNKLLLGSITILVLLVSGCSGNSSNVDIVSSETIETTVSTIEAATPESETEPDESKVVNTNEQTEKSESSAPEYITNIVLQFNDFILDNQLDIEIGKVAKNNRSNSTFYNLSLTYDKAEVKLSIHEYEKEIIKSFEMRFPDNIDNQTLKEFITCCIGAVANTDIDTATEYMKLMTNSFDGRNYSDVYKLNDYTFYIKPSDGGKLSSDCLYLVHESEINQPVDTTLYDSYTASEFQAPLNKGELAYISGTITAARPTFMNVDVLEVETDNEKYAVYYTFSNFPDVFSVGDTYDFYGVIAASNDSYSGCLRLEYFE